MRSEVLSICESLTGRLSSRYDEVAALIYSIDSVMAKIANNQLALNYSQTTYVINLYLVRRGRVFVLELSTSDVDQVVRLGEDLLNYVGFIRESELYAPLPEAKPVKPLNSVDNKVLDYMADPRRLCELMVNSALNEGVERVAGTLSLSTITKALVSSKGFEASEVGTEVVAYLRAFKGDSSGHWAYGSRFADLVRIEEVGRKAAYYALIGERQTQVMPGKYDVILSPLVVGNLIELVAMMTSAFHIMAGFSMFMDRKLGDVVASESLTLIDAPRDVELAGSTAFDDEGVETYDKEIIDKGVLKTLLHNTKTASKLGGKSTGNAGWIVPRVWNLVVSPGSSDEDEMVEEVRNGLLITNNWYTRFQNYVEGTFSTVSRDATLLIRNGEVVGNVGRVRIADNLRRLITNIRLIGREIYPVKWWEVRAPTKAPYILVRDVNVSKPFE